MDESRVHMVAAGTPVISSLGGGGGLGNRVNAVVMSTVLSSEEAAIKQYLTALGIGRQINVTI